MERVPSALILEFQSTLSMRRATAAKLYKEIETIFQSTLSMRRATPPSRPPRRTRWISIHALHEESDAASLAFCWRLIFQSTLSMRRATAERREHHQPEPISIHALHEESDPYAASTRRHNWISIHALHEESDLAICLVCRSRMHFNPRSP